MLGCRTVLKVGFTRKGDGKRHAGSACPSKSAIGRRRRCESSVSNAFTPISGRGKQNDADASTSGARGRLPQWVVRMRPA